MQIIDSGKRRSQTITRSWSTAALVVLACVLYASLAYAQSDSQKLPSLAPMLENVTPAVVNIATTRTARLPDQMRSLNERDLRRFFDNGPEALPPGLSRAPVRAAGSGVIIDAQQGFVITNHHVVNGADGITVALKDGRQVQATLLGSDAATDVALLRIDADNLMALPFADVSALRVGDYVVAIGNPFGIGQTVTSGIVSALGRAGLNAENYEDFIQTDAAINMGNSGGALVDLQGKLVGINTAIISGSGSNTGVGFAVPVDMVAAVVEHLQRDGVVTRGQLGVQIRDYTPVMEQALRAGADRGALVTAVVPNSAAERAGVAVSDVIVSIDGREIESGRELRNIVGLARTNVPVELKLYRDGSLRSISAVIETPTATLAASSAGTEISGRQMDDANYLGARLQTEANNGATGVAVVNVEPESPAWQAGLRAGDIVYEVNRNQINSLRDFNEAITEAGSLAALGVFRDNRRLLVIVS